MVDTKNCEIKEDSAQNNCKAARTSQHRVGNEPTATFSGLSDIKTEVGRRSFHRRSHNLEPVNFFPRRGLESIRREVAFSGDVVEMMSAEDSPSCPPASGSIGLV